MSDQLRIACIGFGEAASAFVTGWGAACAARVRAYDIKTDDADREVRSAKRADYDSAGVRGCMTVAEALEGAEAVFSLVTADQAVKAAGSATKALPPGAFFFDGNSCSPNAKRRSAAVVEAAGGRYVDMAIMAPVHPRLHKTPLLLSGPHADAAAALLARIDMAAKVVGPEVGTASAIKMVRSIMVKGMEALVAECVLAGRRAGVDEAVLASLDATFPGFDFKKTAAYMLERSMTHGVRRAAEMREVAATVDELGLPHDMASAAAAWQQRIGELRIAAGDDDYRARADMLLAGLSGAAAPVRRTPAKPYDDIPGTFVFDSDRSREGYHLNMFCMSLRHAANREAFRADERGYLNRFPMSQSQRQAVLDRDWNEMLRLGGNVYYTSKLAATDGINFQQLAAKMTGMSEGDYRAMMLSGGRPVAGNRRKAEWNHG